MSDTVLSLVDSSIATLDVDQIFLRSAHFVFDCDLDCLTWSCQIDWLQFNRLVSAIQIGFFLLMVCIILN